MKKFLSLIIIFIFTFVLFSCSAGGSPFDGSYKSTEEGAVPSGPVYVESDTPIASKTDKFTAPGLSDFAGVSAGDLFAAGYVLAWATLSGLVIRYLATYEGQEQNQLPPAPAAGQLTASAWNDFLNFGFWQSLFEYDQNTQENGIFSEYVSDQYFNTNNLLEVEVVNGDDKIKGALVELLNSNDDVIYAAQTNVLGKAYLYPRDVEINTISQIKISYQNQVVQNPYTYNELEEDELYHRLSCDLSDVSSEYPEKMQIMFVVDTTGSMGDELEYFKKELEYVIGQIQIENPNSEISVALLFYRDHGDQYVTRYSDFTTDIEAQQKYLSSQSSAGGGDWEEAVDRALSEAVDKNWVDDNSTKIIIHVLDAPPHYQDSQKMGLYSSSIYKASEKGIRIIPVAGSGIDKYTEYLLRCEAMLTGGIYTFLTDDSGIGNGHIVATTGDTPIEYLNNLLVRLINEYHNGQICEIIPYYNDQPNRN